MELTRNNEQSWIETIWQGLDQVLDNMPDDKADDIAKQINSKQTIKTLNLWNS